MTPAPNQPINWRYLIASALVGSIFSIGISTMFALWLDSRKEQELKAIRNEQRIARQH